MGSFALVDKLRANALHGDLSFLPSACVWVLELVHECQEGVLGWKERDVQIAVGRETKRRERTRH
jgi:hypothetical protein